MRELSHPLSADTDGAVRPVLIVDDSAAQRILLRKTLNRWGYATVEAASGAEALEVCQATNIELVISDWMMPGMSGVEFCQKFRALTRRRPAYFILLTAQTDRKTLAEGLEGGADDFLSKPFSLVELKARILAGDRVLSAQRDMIAKNRLLTKALDELQELYAAIDSDLCEARKFQHSLVPDRHIALGEADVSLLYQPSGHVGGDLVGLFRVSDDRYGVYSVDVAGHGVASALMTARIAGHLNASSPERNIALVADDDGSFTMRPPDEVCANLNRLMMQDSETDLYFTMVLADLDLAAGDVIMTQAGHPSPVIQRRDGTVEMIDSYGLPVGLIDDASYDTVETRLGPGDRLLLYSDGITECPDPRGDLFEEERLTDLMIEMKDVTGAGFIEALMKALRTYSGLTEFPVDLSAVLVERKV